MREDVEKMNLLEHYIEEVHSETPYEVNCADNRMIDVDITTNCYGNIKRRRHVFGEAYWEEAKEKGYFMALEEPE